MALWQGKSQRKNTGGRRIYARGKRKFEIGAEIELARIGDVTRKPIRTRGGHHKYKLLFSNWANVTDPKTHKTERTKIVTVVDNPANRNYIRRNILTKGAVIETEKGQARITSKPGQDGAINAVLLVE